MNVVIYHLRPERPHMRAKSLHDIRVRWHAGRDRWFEEVGCMDMLIDDVSGALARAYRLPKPRRPSAPGDVFVVRDQAYAALRDGSFQCIEGIVVPAGTEMTKRDEETLL